MQLPRTRSTRFILVVLFLVSALAGSPFAASPRIILIYGAIVPKPLVLTNWAEHSDLMEATTNSLSVTPESLAGRPYVQVAFFWDIKWKEYMDKGQPPEQLKPEQADQHARFYPAINNLKALFVYEAEAGGHGNSAAWVGLVRSIDQKGLDFLSQHGVQTSCERAATAARAPAAR